MKLLALRTSPNSKSLNKVRPVFPSAVEFIHLKLENFVIKLLNFQDHKGTTEKS